MDGLDINDPLGNNLNDFVKRYRDSLDRAYTANINALNQQKRNAFASTMAAANNRGMMYSNFPERTKYQYEATSYLPNVAQSRSTYQTGLDKLRNNSVDMYNNIKNVEEAIAELNQV